MEETSRSKQGEVLNQSLPAALTKQEICHQPSHDGHIIISKQINKSKVWDCESSLYDSFELNSFNRQLESAINASSRSLSMSHLPEHCTHSPALEHVLPVTTTLTKHQSIPKKGSKFSKSFKKILKSAFGSSRNASNGSPFHKDTSSEKKRNDSFYFHNGSKSVRVLTTIPEMHESFELAGKIKLDAATPHVVRRAASERFTAAIVSVSCTSRYQKSVAYKTNHLYSI